jgi:hypothetical protein
MKKLYIKIFIAFFAAGTLAGCKLDAPIYPANLTTSNTSTNPGTSVNDGNGLPIGTANNIQIKIANITYTFNNNAAFNVLTAGGGQTTLAAEGNTSADKAVLVFPGATASTFALSDVEAGNFKIDLTTAAKVKVTVLTVSNVQGTFSVDMVDASDHTKVYKHCLGSFNINK